MLWLISTSISSSPAMRIDGKAASSEFDGGKLRIMRVVTLHTLFLGSLSTAEEILLQISWRWPDRSGTHSRPKGEREQKKCEGNSRFPTPHRSPQA